MKRVVEIVEVIVKAALTLGSVYFTFYFILAITFDHVPEENIRFADMILGALIGILGVLSKVILDAFTRRR